MITIDIPEGKQVTITGPGQMLLKTQLPTQVASADAPAPEPPPDPPPEEPPPEDEALPLYDSVIPETIDKRAKK